MALPKKIKRGGAFFKGYKCVVATASGEYATYIVETAGYVLNGVSIIPDNYGAGDVMAIQHVKTTAGAVAADVVAVIATNLYNQGAYSGINLDLSAVEQVDAGESIKFIYLNTASVAMNVYLIAELIGIKKTA